MSDVPIRWASIEKICVGGEAVLRERITAELVAATAKVTGDYNPVHVNEAAAGDQRVTGRSPRRYIARAHFAADRDGAAGTWVDLVRE